MAKTSEAPALSVRMVCSGRKTDSGWVALESGTHRANLPWPDRLMGGGGFPEEGSVT